MTTLATGAIGFVLAGRSAGRYLFFSQVKLGINCYPY
jgi:hypothetical protein